MCDIQITYATLKQHQLRRKEKTETMMRYVPLYAAHNAYVWVNRYCFTWLLSMTAGMFQLPYYICTVSQPPRINTTLIQSLFFSILKDTRSLRLPFSMCYFRCVSVTFALIFLKAFLYGAHRLSQPFASELFVFV